jgi:hypothetical protein
VARFDGPKHQDGVLEGFEQMLLYLAQLAMFDLDTFTDEKNPRLADARVLQGNGDSNWMAQGKSEVVFQALIAVLKRASKSKEGADIARLTEIADQFERFLQKMK